MTDAERIAKFKAKLLAGHDPAWKQGSAIPISAEVAMGEMLRIYDRDGRVDPRALWEENRGDGSPLHPAYEWDDAVAAAKQRDEQSRYLTRSVVLVPRRDPSARQEGAPAGRRQETRAWWPMANKPDGEDAPRSSSYRLVTDVLADPQDREELLLRAMREALALRNRFRMLSEMAQVFAAIDSLAVQLAG